MNLRLLAFGAALGLGVVANADIIYNNFGPGDTYNTSTGWTVSNLIGQPAIATPFNVTGSYTLTSLTLALFGGNDYTVSINNGGAVTPGSSLVSWTVLGGGFNTLTPSSTVNLTTGPFYVIVQDLGSSGVGAWNLNSTGDVGPFSYSNGSGWLQNSGDTLAVFRVEAAPVPEPASLLALGGLVGMALRRRRKA